MIINLVTGQEALEGESGWDTTKPYAEQADSVKSQSAIKAMNNFFTGDVATESGNGNTRPVSSIFTEGLAKYQVVLEHYKPVTEKSFRLTRRILLNITENII